MLSAPALMVNVTSNIDSSENIVERIKIGMNTMARCFKMARDELSDRKGGNKVVTVNILSVADMAKHPKKLETASYKIATVGEDLLITAREIIN